ncbi:MoxR family ATPase [Planctomycetota bacterium]|nr:MoxR family ATPase [Planctomycetota bacterium]
MTTSTIELTGDDVRLLQTASQGYAQLEQNISTVVIGQRQIVRALLASIFAEGHVLLIGVPGLAKTLLVKTLSEVLGWDFHRIQFTPDMMPADITGMELLQEDDQGHRNMKFIPGPIFANMILADEINRTPPKTQAALLEAMQERQVTSMGKRYALDNPFIVVATQNPIEQEGTYPLPEAQLDRFMFSLWMDYPSVEDEEAIIHATTTTQTNNLKPIFSKEQLIQFQQLVRRVPVSNHIVSYAVAIARATRPNDQGASEYIKQYVEWGAGTRAAQYMILAGKALAVLDGQPTVSANHVRQAAAYVLRHRVLPNYQAAGEGITAVDIINYALSDVSEPQYS